MAEEQGLWMQMSWWGDQVGRQGLAEGWRAGCLSLSPFSPWFESVSVCMSDAEHALL